MKFDTIWRVGRELFVNLALPYLLYSLAQPRLGDVHALMLSSAPPILWSLVEFAQHRRVDALSILVLAGIILSLLAFAGGGGMRFLQLREKLVTIVIGGVFLGSVAIGRPLMFVLVRAFMMRTDNPELQHLDALKDNRHFRTSMSVMSAVWGAGLLVDGAVSIVLVYALSIRSYLIAGPIVGYVTVGFLILWNIWYGRRRRQARETANLSSSNLAASES